MKYDLYLPIYDENFNLIESSNHTFQPLTSTIPDLYREAEKIYSFNNVRLKKIQSSSIFGVIPVFTLGKNKLIKGFKQGLYNMCVGEQRILIIPPELAYGDSWAPGISPRSTVIFHIELVKIDRKAPQQLRLD